MYLETSDRRSLFHDRSPLKNCFFTEVTVRKDLAACVSLSSYSLVKQPGSKIALPTFRWPERPTKLVIRELPDGVSLFQ